MKLLILGGTGFLGPHIVEYALSRSHAPTLFNRGRTNPHLFPDIEKLQGDRDPRKGDGLKALEGRQWDAVVDTSGYYPRAVKASAELLGPNVRQYVFISTVSAYSDLSRPGMDEDGPIGTLNDETVETVSGETYGPLKALCERAVQAAMPGRATVIRPGLIVGPGDPTDRFTYWPVRIERAGEVLAPGAPDAPVQFIDARDLARFCVQVIEDGHTGTYNALGPKGTLTMQELLHGCKCVAGSDASFTWVDEAWLLEQRVRPWMELPLWVPQRGDTAGFARINAARAVGVGLACRPCAQTIQATLDWHKTRGPDEAFKATLRPQREVELLTKWRARNAEGPDPRP